MVQSAMPNAMTNFASAFGNTLAFWWCVRLVYGRSVLLQRPTHRLVGSAPEAEISTQLNIERYLSRARKQLNLLR
jgi:hypothetical protein